MWVNAEVTLMAALLGLYLYDSAQLLYFNEALMMPKGKDEWAVLFGSASITVSGKEPYIPNPFTMHLPLFRLSWKLEQLGEISKPWIPPRTVLKPLIPFVWGMAAALFILFPLGFFTRLADRALMTGLILLFSCIIAALGWVWAHRAELCLSNKQFTGLAFESVICPPFALNMIRHVAIAMPVREDLISAAQRLQGFTNWEQTRAQLIMRLENAIEYEGTESVRYSQLQERRRALINEGAA